VLDSLTAGLQINWTKVQLCELIRTYSMTGARKNLLWIVE